MPVPLALPGPNAAAALAGVTEAAATYDDTMHPDLQAAADQVKLDTAHVLTIAAALTEADADNFCPAPGWTVRQLLGHLTAAWDDYAASVERLTSGQPTPEGPGGDDLTAAAVARAGVMGLPALTTELRRARDRFIEAMARIPGDRAGDILAGQALSEILATLAAHVSRHALDFIDALPALKEDGLALNWVLWPEHEDPGLAARQALLLKEIRESSSHKPKRKRKVPQR
jgi:Mycothiol maleylpyruvate isomerase N-terminal domain